MTSIRMACRAFRNRPRRPEKLAIDVLVAALIFAAAWAFIIWCLIGV